MRRKLGKIIPILVFMILLTANLTITVKAVESASIKLNVGVKVEGGIPTNPEEFEITLTKNNEKNPMPEGAVGNIKTIIVKGGGSNNFAINFLKIGQYEYEITQKSKENSNVKYDKTVYKIVVLVTYAIDASDPKGELKATVIVNKDGTDGKIENMLFTNTYPTPTTPTSPALAAKVKLRALKTLDEEIPGNQKFTFLLSDDNGTILQTKINEAQNIDFDEMEYSKIGTSIYYIREKIEVDGKYVYDDTVYQVIVKVSRNNNGDYEANTSYLINGTPFTRVPIFENETVPGKLPDTGGEEEPEPEPGELPDTGGEKPGPVVVPDTGVKPGPPELPKTGEAKSTLPMVGIIMILGGITLSLRRKATK